jgi:hypothetical protein
MSKIKVTALSSFMHGRVHMQAGQTEEFTKGDADELVKAGLVVQGEGQEQSAQPQQPQPQAADQAQEAAPVEKAQPIEGDPAAHAVPVDISAEENGPSELDDLLGEEKAEPDPENKMEKPASNKASKARGK